MSESKRFDQEQLRGAKFHGCGLAQAEFEDVDLADSRFTNVNFRGASFTNISLQDAKLTDVNLANVSIDDANISGLTIFGWNITRTDQRGAAEKRFQPRTLLCPCPSMRPAPRLDCRAASSASRGFAPA